jgi:hypothetical protein
MKLNIKRGKIGLEPTIFDTFANALPLKLHSRKNRKKLTAKDKKRHDFNNKVSRSALQQKV